MPRLSDDSALIELEEAHMEDGARIRGGKIEKLDWTDLKCSNLQIDEILFSHCRFGGSSLTSVRLRDVKFEECDLQGSDFSEGSFLRVEFRGCRLTGFVAGSAFLEGVLFANSKLDLSSLRGAETFEAWTSKCPRSPS